MIEHAPPPQKKRYRSRRGVNAAIIENLQIPAISRPTWGEVAERCKVELSVVYDQINRLRKAGHIPPMGQDLAGPRVAGPEKAPPEPNSLAQDFERVANDTNMPAEKRRAELKRIVDWGSDALKIKAIEVLNKMDEAADRGIGPIPPKTREERVKRLADLDRAVGYDEAMEAMEVAFGQAKTQESAPRANDSQQPAGSALDLGGRGGGHGSGREAGGHSGRTGDESQSVLAAAEDEEGSSGGVRSIADGQHRPMELNGSSEVGEEVHTPTD